MRIQWSHVDVSVVTRTVNRMRLVICMPSLGPAAACTRSRSASEIGDAVTVRRASSDPAKETNGVKSDEEWKRTLTPEQYDVLRKKGTERAFTGKYWSTKDDGTYVCAGCGA